MAAATSTTTVPKKKGRQCGANSKQDLRSQGIELEDVLLAGESALGELVEELEYSGLDKALVMSKMAAERQRGPDLATHLSMERQQRIHPWMRELEKAEVQLKRTCETHGEAIAQMKMPLFPEVPELAALNMKLFARTGTAGAGTGSDDTYTPPRICVDTEGGEYVLPVTQNAQGQWCVDLSEVQVAFRTLEAQVRNPRGRSGGNGRGQRAARGRGTSRWAAMGKGQGDKPQGQQTCQVHTEFLTSSQGHQMFRILKHYGASPL